MFPQGCELGVSQTKQESMVLKFCASASIMMKYQESGIQKHFYLANTEKVSLLKMS